MEREVQQYKKDQVKEIVSKLEESKVIGIVNLYKMPSPQLQKIKKELSDKAKIRICKKSVILHALQECKKENIGELESKLGGQPGLMFSSDNPFSIYKFLKKNKSPAPAKPGMIAPKDVLVSAGMTEIAAGPAIGQLQKAGLQTSIKDGKIEIMKDRVVVKSGEEISPDVSSVLAMLDIKPMEIGLDLVAAYEDGVIFAKDVMDVDEDQYEQDLMSLVKNAINLSVNSGYITHDTAEISIIKAFREAHSVGIEGSVLEPDLVEELIEKAQRQANSIVSEAGIDLSSEAPKEEPAEKEESAEKKEDAPEEKTEEKTEEKKEEPAEKADNDQGGA